mmetsp:Transcript_58174/g.134251  ORF Transcript_58174/g.134251 Transcript_58174/m.134251 type:complete len:298 (-) Transcript_58174:3440-4333(-)
MHPGLPRAHCFYGGYPESANAIPISGRLLCPAVSESLRCGRGGGAADHCGCDGCLPKGAHQAGDRDSPALDHHRPSRPGRRAPGGPHDARPRGRGRPPHGLLPHPDPLPDPVGPGVVHGRLHELAAGRVDRRCDLRRCGGECDRPHRRGGGGRPAAHHRSSNDYPLPAGRDGVRGDAERCAGVHPTGCPHPPAVRDACDGCLLGLWPPRLRAGQAGPGLRSQRDDPRSAHRGGGADPRRADSVRRGGQGRGSGRDSQVGVDRGASGCSGGHYGSEAQPADRECGSNRRPGHPCYHRF